ncbi:MAG: ATP-grasp domain-containing protein [Limnothrix sp. RL_2_0]|nr:ATP-grasp domain-containing protein [Limnothrix sp. RL_2_0]
MSQDTVTVRNQTILLTGGRAPVTLDLARQFTKAGHRILVADSLQHQLCSASRAVVKNFVVPAPRTQPSAYISALLEIIQTEQVDYLIPTCEEVFYIAAGLAELQLHCQVFAEPLETLNRWHNKWLFIQRMESLGLVTPNTWLIESPEDLEDLLKNPSPQKLVLKPVYSRFASQVHFINKPIAALPNIDLRPDKPWVAQEFIAGTHYCIYGVAHQGQLRAFAAYSTVFTAGAGSCIYFESVHHSGLLHWLKTVVAAEQFTGQIAFDLIETADGILYPLECNPRAISAIHLFNLSDRLDLAFLNQEMGDHLILPQTDRPAMIAMAMLVYGLPAAIASQRFKVWLTAMMTAKDVIFQKDDPLPALHLGFVMGQFIAMAIQKRQSLQRVSTQDIEWDGAPINVSL